MRRFNIGSKRSCQVRSFTEDERIVSRKKVSKKYIALFVALVVIMVFLYCGLRFFNLVPKKYYTADDFGIKTIKSSNDYNNNGIDDYTDILLGARNDAKNNPKYKSAYYEGGYPPDNEGVCTDVIWRAFENAGYCLRDMVDDDINKNIDMYPRVGGMADKNIDFRRVPNLKVFFDNNAESLTLDTSEIEQWQPGDIVIFGEEYVHIGIISDKRNSKGIPYLIHNGGQLNREEDMLFKYTFWEPITGHYRFN